MKIDLDTTCDNSHILDCCQLGQQLKISEQPKSPIFNYILGFECIF